MFCHFHKLALSGLVALLCVSCEAADTSDSVGEAPWEHAEPARALFDESGRPAAEWQGVWRSRGYGYILDITPEGLTRYDEGAFCFAVPEEVRELSPMATARYQLGRFVSDDVAIFQLLSGDTQVVWDRLEALPEACQTPTYPHSLMVGDVFLDHFSRHYAFFDRRLEGVEARVDGLRATLDDQMTETELFDALSRFMDGLSDSHTKLRRRENGTLQLQQDGLGETLTVVRETSDEGSWLVSILVCALEELGPTASHTLNDRLVWGVLEPEPGRRVGYLQLFVMGGFIDRDDFATEAWAREEMAAFNAEMDRVFAEFEGVDAVIVDLSNNRGGWDQISKALAARFTDQRFLAYTTQAHGSGLAPYPHFIEPAAGPRFTGPTYVLTSDVTVSGGELATLALRQLPNIIHAGTPTRGAFSTPLPKPLPNGWLLEVSNEIFAAPDGQVFEEFGLPPELEIDVFPRGEPFDTHWNAVETVIDVAISD